MSSDPRAGMAGALGIAILTLAAPAGDPAADFATAQFRTPPSASTVELRGPVVETAERILGHAVPQPAIRYWRGDGRTV